MTEMNMPPATQTTDALSYFTVTLNLFYDRGAFYIIADAEELDDIAGQIQIQRRAMQRILDNENEPEIKKTMAAQQLLVCDAQDEALTLRREQRGALLSQCRQQSYTLRIPSQAEYDAAKRRHTKVLDSDAGTVETNEDAIRNELLPVCLCNPTETGTALLGRWNIASYLWSRVLQAALPSQDYLDFRQLHLKPPSMAN